MTVSRCSRLSRRTLLQSAISGSLATGVSSSPTWGAERPQPSFVVVIILCGGYDPVLTFDPKDASLVGDKIDCQYRADERMQGATRLYGPLVGRLREHDSDLAIVHGVRVDTVSHEQGLRMVRNWGHIFPSPSRPIGEAIGQALSMGSSTPLLTLDEYADTAAPSLGLPRSAVDALTTPGAISLPPRWAYALERAHLAEMDTYYSDRADMRRLRKEELRAASKLNRFALTKAISGFQDPQLGNRLRLTLHALCHNLASCIFVITDMLQYDSHTDNLRIQTQRTQSAMNDISVFLDHLKRTKVGSESLFERTTVVVGTEMGRFPKLNDALGKDHWPENTWLVAGRGIRGGVTLGQTDDRLRGLKVNFSSGSLTGDGRQLVSVDALYATLLKNAGGNLKAQGYSEDLVLRTILTPV